MRRSEFVRGAGIEHHLFRFSHDPSHVIHAVTEAPSYERPPSREGIRYKLNEQAILQPQSITGPLLWVGNFVSAFNLRLKRPTNHNRNQWLELNCLMVSLAKGRDCLDPNTTRSYAAENQIGTRKEGVFQWRDFFCAFSSEISQGSPFHSEVVSGFGNE